MLGGVAIRLLTVGRRERSWSQKSERGLYYFEKKFVGKNRLLCERKLFFYQEGCKGHCQYANVTRERRSLVISLRNNGALLVFLFWWSTERGLGNKVRHFYFFVCVLEIDCCVNSVSVIRPCDFVASSKERERKRETKINR